MAKSHRSEQFSAFGISCVVGGTIFYCAMDSMVKWISPSYSIVEITFFRMAFSFIPLLGLIFYERKPNAIKTGRFKSHFLRSVFGTVGMLLIFWSFSVMPLLDVSVITLTTPLFVTALSGPLLKERVSGQSWSALIIGLLATLLVMKPSMNVFGLASLLPLIGSFFVALYVIMARLLSGTESTVSLSFYATVLGTISTGALVPFTWVTPHVADLLFLCAIGLVGGVAVLFRTAGYRATPPAIAAPLEYASLLWYAMIGYAVFKETPKTESLVAGTLIVLSNVLLLGRQTKYSQWLLLRVPFRAKKVDLGP